MTIKNELLKDIVITAVEGGINYWAVVKNYQPSLGKFRITEIVDDDLDEGKSLCDYRVDLDTVRRGYIRAIESGYTFDDNTCLDAIEADVVIQFGLFDQVLYG